MNAIAPMRRVFGAMTGQPFVPATVEVVQPADIPRALEIVRGRHGLSTRSAGDLAGVSCATISRAERGRPIDAVTLVALSAFIHAWWDKEPAS